MFYIGDYVRENRQGSLPGHVVATDGIGDHVLTVALQPYGRIVQLHASKAVLVNRPQSVALREALIMLHAIARGESYSIPDWTERMIDMSCALADGSLDDIQRVNDSIPSGKPGRMTFDRVPPRE